MVPGSMVLLALARSVFTVPIHFTAMAGTASATLALGILYVCLSEGEVWKDQSAKLLAWMAVGGVAAVWNIASLNSIARSDGSRWVSLIILGQLGCVTAIALQLYPRLGEWSMAGLGAAAGASLVGALFCSKAKLHYGWPLSTVVMPLAIMAIACLSVSHFFEAKPLPKWLIASVLFLPTLVCVVDIVVGRLMNTWLRVFLAGCICCLVLGAIFNITKPWQLAG